MKGFTGKVEKVDESVAQSIPIGSTDPTLSGEGLYLIGEYIIPTTFIITSGFITPSSDIDVYDQDDKKLNPDNITTQTHYIKLVVKSNTKLNIQLTGKKYQTWEDEPTIVIKPDGTLDKEETKLPDIEV